MIRVVLEEADKDGVAPGPDAFPAFVVTKTRTQGPSEGCRLAAASLAAPNFIA
jgi:hypothetical protein